MGRATRWLDERTGMGETFRAFTDRRIPREVGWLHTFGSALVFLFGIQVVTGVLLALNYVASPDGAYASVRYLQFAVPFGALLRGVHLWTAYAIVGLIALHLLRTLVYGAYKYPRELTWLTGVFLFLVTLGFAFTGYLLPWNQRAYWATDVGTNIAGSVPLIGNAILRVLRGGTAIGAATLARFYAFHVLVLPGLLVLLVAVHLFLVIRQGIAAPPRLQPLREPVPGETIPDWYRREYAEEKRLGKPFSEALLKDATVATALFAAILVLAAVFGAPVGHPANPNSTNYVPRPDWYFLDVFQILRYIKGNLEPVGTFVLPALFFLLLIGLPFFDRRRERHPLRRPLTVSVATLAVAVAVGLTYLGATAPAAGAPTALPGAVSAASALTAEQVAGEQVVLQAGCLNCHTIDHTGGSVGPDLSHIGSQLSEPQILATVTDGKGGMPAWKSSLTSKQIQEAAAFLASRR